jgi:hypothetical protein
MSIDLHVKYPLFLSWFNEILIFSADFRKILKSQVSWKCIQSASSFSVRADRRTDRQTEGRTNITKLTVVFRNFANAPQNWMFCVYLCRKFVICFWKDRILLYGNKYKMLWLIQLVITFYRSFISLKTCIYHSKFKKKYNVHRKCVCIMESI